MKKKTSDRMVRLLKVLWLPVVLLVLIVAEPYFGISKSPYAWAYLGFQILLFVAYAYLLYKDRPKYVPPSDRVLKGKRKIKK